MNADHAGEAPRPFDVRTVGDLVRLMTEHDLTEIDLHDGRQRIRLRKGALTAVAAAPVMAAPVVASPQAATPMPTATVAAPAKQYHTIRSEMPCTFYAKSKPDAPAPYVTVGSKVAKDTPVCLIEAMKSFSVVNAECNGTIVEVCVEDGQFVEYNTVLFRVDLA